MIRKILEAFLRHKLLILLLPILIPAIVTPLAFMALPPQYTTFISVWIESPTYLSTNNGANPFVSPVQGQASRLTELLHTRAFLEDVAGRTSLAPMLATPAGEIRAAEVIGKAVSLGGGNGANSEHLLVVQAQAATAQLSFELCQAIVDAYQDKTAADRSDQASVAVDFYQSRVQDAQKQMTQATQNLQRYVAAQNGGSGTSIDLTQTNLPATMLDPKLGQLETSLQLAQAAYNNAQTALTQAQRDAQASAQGQQLGFQVLDPAQMPTTPTPQTKKIIIYPIAALVVGLGLSAVMLVLLVASDHSARSHDDLGSSVRVLGSVPFLKLKGVPKNLRAVGTRRAIGAAAGTALPAPAGTK